MINLPLLFFYGLISLLIIFLVIKFINDSEKWYILTYFISLLVGVLISYHYFTEKLFLISFIFSMSIYLSVLSIYFFIMASITKKQLRKTINAIKLHGSSYLEDNLITPNEKPFTSNCWYVIYFPSDAVLEIGVNIFRATPQLYKKFYIHTLSGRIVYIKPESLKLLDQNDQNILTSLSGFYSFSKRNKIIVDNYADAIKSETPEPWIISEDIE
ncbi:hypothetical protein FNO09_22610 [Salmonella enterica subsp. diarizonae]|nr:hypothetical protein [Salmonella enterica subsp. diarizonae]EAO8179653.1 hypothetical protein [Salmonella enterica]EBV2374838.1 hypothetical protein [Salmonella enterica subsp. enterica serovar Enteritidis]EGL0765125.1 hypothetical protein [Salmonella enterica subsp. enterica]EBA4670897.1 hypothetical protein [Salmonella enterica]